MKIAYLILAHKEPQQLYQMIESLYSKDVQFFVHIDVASSINDFKKLFDNKQYVNISSKFKTSWGSFNLVRSELHLLEKAFAWGADRYVLLSGQDYPIKSNDQIALFFEQNKNIGFIEGEKLPKINWSEHQNGLFRINRFHFEIFGSWKSFPPHSKKPILRQIFNKSASWYFKLFIRNKQIKDYYHGGQWWVLTLKQVDYVLRNSNFYTTVFKRFYIADELFIQTLLYNAPEGMFKLKNHNLHFIKWPDYSSSPEVLTTDYFDELLSSNKLFARKFDFVKSENLVNKLNAVNSGV
ncbi:MAG: hypothetical protein KDC79_11565 [Cyclobacteriaceae bacterium]|nr:hypothetical protein [Cyclobacteriaceae bacterium]